MNSEREKLVQQIVAKSSQPTLDDAVSLMKFEPIRSVNVLFKLHEWLRKIWVDKRLN